jgi:O-antigen ligase
MIHPPVLRVLRGESRMALLGREPGDAGRPPLIWRSGALRLLLGAFPIWSATAVLTFHTTWRLKLIVGAMAVVTLATPAAGLCALAVLTPLAMIIGTALGVEGYRMAEMLVITFLAAWLLRAGSDRNGPRVPAGMAAAGWLLAAATVTSVAVLAWRMREFPADLTDTVARLWGAYFLFPDRIGFIDAARMVEGLGLVVATLHVFRRKPSLAVSLPAALCAGGAGAGAMSVLIWRGVGPTALVDAFARIGYRSAHIYDVNAAGSYFALVLCLAMGMAWRAPGVTRVLWTIAALVSGSGLWLSQSRSAFAAIVVTAGLAIVWLATAAWTRRARVAAVALVIALGLAGSFARVWLLEHDPTFRGAGFRQQFYVTSLRMISARPLSGVGIGQYARMSSLFLTPQLAWTYGSENAHNYFLQIGGELGLPGLTFFLIWIGTAMAVMVRSLVHAPDPRLLGASAGVLAFVSTCLTGHPLLVGEVAFPFWIQFGLTLGLAASPLVLASPGARDAIGSLDPNPRAHDVPVPGRSWPPGLRPRRLWPVTAALACVVVATGFVSAGAGPIEPPKSQAVDGFYPWETAEDGRRFRWTGSYGSLFVPAEIKRVYIPMRLPIDSTAIAPMAVEIVTGGVDHGHVFVGRNWVTLDLGLPEVAPPLRFKRIDLRMPRTWQPAVYVPGSYDMRLVGVQVGECELVR